MAALITVHAGSLQRFLEGLAFTVSKHADDHEDYRSVFLRTGMAVVDGAVSPSQVLTGMTTDGLLMARMHLACNGELPQPAMLPADQLPWLIPVLRGIARDDKEALVTLKIDAASHAAELIVETNAEKLHKVSVRPVDAFPVSTLDAAFEGKAASKTVTDKDGTPLPEGALTAWSGQIIAVLAGVSKKFDEDVYEYRTAHPASSHIVVIGPWRGVIPAAQYPVDVSVDAPDDQEAL